MRCLRSAGSIGAICRGNLINSAFLRIIESMATHNQRLHDISRFAGPPEGSAAYKQLLALNENNLKDPGFRKKLKESFEKAFAMTATQDKNGAGLPLDKEIRHFLREFNDRNWKHGLRAMPSSFNVLEALFNYEPSIQFFELIEEENYLFNFYDFIDFITSNSFTEKRNLINDNLAEGLIYHFDISNNIEDITFSTTENEEYAIAGVSIIREENEGVIFLLTGLKVDTEAETK